MGQEGLLLQADGSPHRWLGPDGPEWTLIAGVDDATGRVEHAVFREQEDAAGSLLWLRRDCCVEVVWWKHGGATVSGKRTGMKSTERAGGPGCGVRF